MPTTYYNDLVRYPKAFAYIIEESIATKDTLKIICFRQLIVKETSSFQYLIFFWQNQKVLHGFLEPVDRFMNF